MRPVKKWLLCLTTLYLICSPACSETTENSIDALRIRAGWTAPAAGYYLTDTAMRDAVAGWTEARKVADVRQQALEALRDEIAAQTQQMKRDLADLQREIVLERQAWRTSVRRGKAQGFVYGILAGFAGGYLVKRNNP